MCSHDRSTRPSCWRTTLLGNSIILPPLTLPHYARAGPPWPCTPFPFGQPIHAAGRARPARRSHGLASLGADQVLLFGGLDADYIRLGDSWVYVLGEDEWTQWLPAVSPSARNDHAMASTGSDQVLLFGGMDGNYDGETWLATGFLFVPSTAVYVPLVTR